MVKEPEDVEKWKGARRGAEERPAEQGREERVSRVLASVRSGTYQLRSDVVANRLMETMMRQPRKR